MSMEKMLQPTAKTERISSVDIIRGIALLGILLMNIIGFGLYKAYWDPTNSGGATGLNLKAWWINTMFFEGTMRGMFSMLFGAGIILFTGRTVGEINSVSVTDAYFRRILWLLLFGIIHGYILLWQGEILYPYALIGLFAYSFRNWAPKHLIIGAATLCLVFTVWNVKDYFEMKDVSESAKSAQIKKAAGAILTKSESKSIAKWDAEIAGKKPTTEDVSEAGNQLTEDYFSAMMFRAPRTKFNQTSTMYRVFFWDIFAMMLLGMCFLKNGILKAQKSNKYYLIMILAGYAIGLSTNYFEANYIMTHKFEILSFYYADITHELGRVPTTIGHVGLIMLFIKSGIFPFLQRSLAAVGQMAFTNYIMQTIICNFIFLGFGFAMFGKFQRYELYYIVVGIWIFQMIVSPIWLRYFRFGPLEWAWRSLTYWQRQPMKR